MKSTLLSSTLLLAVIQVTYGAPLTSSAVSKRSHKSQNRIAALAHNMKTLPPAMIPGENSTLECTSKTLSADYDPIDEYLVVMTEAETRPWNEIFEDMGYNTTRMNAPRDTFTSFEDGLDTNHIAFKTEEGTRIDTFGKNLRAFTMKMRLSEAEGMMDGENIATLEKNGMAYATVMPRDETDVAAELQFEEESNSTWPEEEFSGIRKRQNQSRIQQQNTAPWNLQRVSAANKVNARGRRATDLTFNYRFDQAAGSGVDVYVLDSGINTAHSDFRGRATMGFSGFGNNRQDDVGHGSHCSGTIGGQRFGVAKNVNLIGAKVLAGPRGNGPFSAIMGGLEFAYTRHLQRMRDPSFKGSVVSMSLGGRGRPAAIQRAMEMATRAGIHFSVAAGNDNADACGFWPAGFSASLPIITVGATDINDNRASFSNFGRCVDIHAPGVAIVSSHNRGPQSITSMQGTSMACPAVSGMIADELVRNPNLKLDPQGMKQLILSKAVKGVIRGANNAPNMLNNGLR
ncbi:hypothetical protein H072_4120 [Dactylellina haptotyla CBS 200.50]|uniref:Peptidase S8/S53 domain-containing protein n=1 Tax=Dactylellina haptotyla (strain CBS 200.50) TaxID=1284197 RepID=S8ALE6_DACHA|nr:hypothetical protein H072_4120 [Dactylellina haptotyla CBS 200.50]